MELIWTILALLPEVNLYTWGVEMLEVLWKAFEAIIDNQINMVVTFHKVLHGFRTSRGIGTFIVEINMA